MHPGHLVSMLLLSGHKVPEAQTELEHVIPEDGTGTDSGHNQ